MELIKCNTCNKEIAANAKTCPNCGAPNELVRVKNKALIKNTLIIAVIIIAVVSIILVATNGKPDMDSRVYNYGIDSLGVVDDYLDGKISGSEAVHKLDKIYNKLEQLGELADPDSLRLSTDALLVRISVSSVKWEINSFGLDLDTTSTDIINARNDLAKKLNKKQR